MAHVYPGSSLTENRSSATETLRSYQICRPTNAADTSLGAGVAMSPLTQSLDPILGSSMSGVSGINISSHSQIATRAPLAEHFQCDELNTPDVVREMFDFPASRDLNLDNELFTDMDEILPFDHKTFGGIENETSSATSCASNIVSLCQDSTSNGTENVNCGIMGTTTPKCEFPFSLQDNVKPVNADRNHCPYMGLDSAGNRNESRTLYAPTDCNNKPESYCNDLNFSSSLAEMVPCHQSATLDTGPEDSGVELPADKVTLDHPQANDLMDDADFNRFVDEINDDSISALDMSISYKLPDTPTDLDHMELLCTSEEPGMLLGSAEDSLKINLERSPGDLDHSAIINATCEPLQLFTVPTLANSAQITENLKSKFEANDAVESRMLTQKQSDLMLKSTDFCAFTSVDRDLNPSLESELTQMSNNPAPEIKPSVNPGKMSNLLLEQFNPVTHANQSGVANESSSLPTPVNPTPLHIEFDPSFNIQTKNELQQHTKPTIKVSVIRSCSMPRHGGARAAQKPLKRLAPQSIPELKLKKVRLNNNSYCRNTVMGAPFPLRNPNITSQHSVRYPSVSTQNSVRHHSIQVLNSVPHQNMPVQNSVLHPSTPVQVSVLHPSTPVQVSVRHPSTPVQISVRHPSTPVQVSVRHPSTPVQNSVRHHSTPVRNLVRHPGISVQNLVRHNNSVIIIPADKFIHLSDPSVGQQCNASSGITSSSSESQSFNQGNIPSETINDNTLQVFCNIPSDSIAGPSHHIERLPDAAIPGPSSRNNFWSDGRATIDITTSDGESPQDAAILGLSSSNLSGNNGHASIDISMLSDREDESEDSEDEEFHVSPRSYSGKHRRSAGARDSAFVGFSRLPRGKQREIDAQKYRRNKEANNIASKKSRLKKKNMLEQMKSDLVAESNRNERLKLLFEKVQRQYEVMKRIAADPNTCRSCLSKK
ncbi:uncharacterized protein LOC108683075 [Hyalella azteca]|uniref:Uncharacterized protein LOC108683075 n=1 Tax=Hyalella azteca TaxID=294128 RepID=A0A8B7PNR3_HYAAZ|nr:uncharacterized protein LOC108683075 [Hyalella azteca]